MDTSPKTSSSTPTWVKITLALAIAGLILLYGTAIYSFGKNAWLSITFPNNMDYGEGPILNQAVMLSRFQNVYPTDLDSSPYIVTNYPPMLLVVQVPFIWIFGTQFWYGRLISTLAVIAGAASIGIIIYTLTKNRLAAIVAGLTLLSVPYIIDWAPTNRVDSLALGFSLIGLMLIVRAPNDRRQRILAAVFFVMAAYTKQLYAFCAPFAAFVFLLHQKPRRKAFELFFWVAGLGAAIFALLTLVTGGGFYKHLILANNNAYYWQTTQYYLTEIWKNFGFFVIAAGLFLLTMIFKRTRHPAWWLVAPYVAAAGVISLAIGKDGSYINYLFEFSAAVALIAGMWLVMLPHIFPKAAWVKILVVLALVYPVWQMTELTDEKYMVRVESRTNEEFEVRQLFNRVKEMEGTVLLDEYMGFLPLLDRPIYFQPFERKMMADDGIWDETQFVNEIKEKKFSAIIVYYPEWAFAERGRWTQAQAAAIRENYVEGQTIAHGTIFIPREDWMDFDIHFDDEE